jgi:hypothetical protein
MHVGKRIIDTECQIPQPPIGRRPLGKWKMQSRFWSGHGTIPRGHEFAGVAYGPNLTAGSR